MEVTNVAVPESHSSLPLQPDTGNKVWTPCSALQGRRCQLGSSSHLQVSPLSVLMNEMAQDIFRKQKNTTV